MVSRTAAKRARCSPFPIISMEEAFELIFQQSPRPVAHSVSFLSLDPAYMQGCVLAEDILSPRDIPSQMTTNVDGYAMRTGESGTEFSVLTSATLSPEEPLPWGSVFRINTGAALPQGADAVVMVEDTEVLEETSDGARREEKRVRILAPAHPLENVRQPGSDVRKGNTVMKAGTVLNATGGDLAALHFIGADRVRHCDLPL